MMTQVQPQKVKKRKRNLPPQDLLSLALVDSMVPTNQTLPEDFHPSELSALFEKYGKLEKRDVLRSFAFVVSEIQRIELLRAASRPFS